MVRKSILMLLAAMLVMGFSALSMAQEGGAKPEAAKPAEGAKPEAAKAGAKAGKRLSRVEMALSKLTLTEEQNAKISPIVAAYKEKTAAAKLEDRPVLHKEVAAQILPLLTEEQKPKFEEALKAKGRGGKKAGAEPKKEEKKEGEAPKTEGKKEGEAPK